MRLVRRARYIGPLHIVDDDRNQAPSRHPSASAPHTARTAHASACADCVQALRIGRDSRYCDKSVTDMAFVRLIPYLRPPRMRSDVFSAMWAPTLATSRGAGCDDQSPFCSRSSALAQRLSPRCPTCLRGVRVRSMTSAGLRSKCDSITRQWNHRSATSPTSAFGAPPWRASLAASTTSVASSPIFFSTASSSPLWNRVATRTRLFRIAALAAVDDRREAHQRVLSWMKRIP